MTTHPFHIFMTVINLLCGLAFLLMISTGSKNEALAMFALVGGALANMSAVIISIFLSIIYLVKLISGNTRQLIARHGLGLFNGIFVILCWYMVGPAIYLLALLQSAV